MTKKVPITLRLDDIQAWALSELVKRLCRNNLGENGLELVVRDEVWPAEQAVMLLRDALADAGYTPR
jgi:hypothetical protein